MLAERLWGPMDRIGEMRGRHRQLVPPNVTPAGGAAFSVAPDGDVAAAVVLADVVGAAALGMAGERRGLA